MRPEIIICLHLLFIVRVTGNNTRSNFLGLSNRRRINKKMESDYRITKALKKTLRKVLIHQKFRQFRSRNYITVYIAQRQLVSMIKENGHCVLGEHKPEHLHIQSLDRM